MLIASLIYYLWLKMLCAPYVNCVLMLKNWLFELYKLYFFKQEVNDRKNCSRMSLSGVIDNIYDSSIAIGICDPWITDNECDLHVADATYDSIKRVLGSLNIFSPVLFY